MGKLANILHLPIKVLGRGFREKPATMLLAFLLPMALSVFLGNEYLLNVQIIIYSLFFVMLLGAVMSLVIRENL